MIGALELRDARVMVTGSGGFLGRSLVGKLEDRGAKPLPVRSADYDLTDRAQVMAALRDLQPSYILHAAAVVGGIGANREHPGKFFYDNAVMGVHLLHESHVADVEKVVVVGTVCSYPKFTPVPFKEEDIWNGYPEETNAPYGLAKKMLLVQAQAYRAEYGFQCAYVIPTNLYGPGDNFDLHTSHVIPAMIRKCFEATSEGQDEVAVWGTGRPTREFLYVDDAAEGIVSALERYESPEPLNLGSGEEITIRDLAHVLAEATGYKGRFVWDADKPDGQPRRAIDSSRAHRELGWTPRVSLKEGIARTVDWYEQQISETIQPLS